MDACSSAYSLLVLLFVLSQGASIVKKVRAVDNLSRPITRSQVVSMSAIKQTSRLEIAKDTYMTFHIDESKPEGHIERYFSLTTRGIDADDSLIEVPKHWHKHHDEYMACTEGQIELYLDGQTILAKPGDPPVFLERRRVHGFRFPQGQRAVLKEMTQPTGEFKQHFFEDIFENLGFWGVMRGFADGDTYIALPGPFRWLDELYMLVIGALASLFHPRRGARPNSIAPLIADESKKEL